MARGEIRRLMVFMPPGSAKALALDTPIPTPDGWKAMGGLKVGDHVFDENGQPCSVTWVSPIWKDRPVYRVTTDCGDTIIADRDHEWRVRLCGKPRRPLKATGKGAPPRSDRDDPASRFKIKETHELERKRAKRPMIERAKAIELPDVELPVDPYLLGVWLGDGTSSNMAITASLDDQPFIRAELERLGYRTTDRSVPTLFGVSGVRAEFVSLGLINDPAHKTYGRKHIPPAYMRASAKQRLALLQGLVDTDGTVCRSRGCTTFCNTNRELADQVRELVRSLGVKAGWSEGRAMLDGKDCGPVYRVGFYLDGSARMPRKAALTRNQDRTPDTYIDVEPAGLADTICIEVDSPSHLFLCGRSMTPTHNSTYSSILFPAWWLAQAGDGNVIAASHSMELAERFGRKVRALVTEHGLELGYGLSADSQAAGRWSTNKGREYFAAGVGVGIAGFRSALSIIDDPFRSRQDAESQLIRDRVWEWYNDDLDTRLTPGGSVALVCTRWHDDDLAGRLLQRMASGGEYWDVLSLPAIATADDPLGRPEGAWLWEDEYGYADRLREKHATSDARSWSALYQQQPTPDTGDYFRREWLIPVEHTPPATEMRVYGGSDYAVTADGGDYTVHAVLGVDHDGTPYLLDVWRRQTSSDEWIDAWCDLVLKWRPIGWSEEQGQIRAGVGPFLDRRARERRAFVARDQFPTRGDKAVRAQSFRGLCATRGLRIPAAAPWRSDVENELLRFPASVHDDIVDALGLIGQLLDKVTSPTRPKLNIVKTSGYKPMGHKPQANSLKVM